MPSKRLHGGLLRRSGARIRLRQYKVVNKFINSGSFKALRYTLYSNLSISNNYQYIEVEWNLNVYRRFRTTNNNNNNKQIHLSYFLEPLISFNCRFKTFIFQWINGRHWPISCRRRWLRGGHFLQQYIQIFIIDILIFIMWCDSADNSDEHC